MMVKDEKYYELMAFEAYLRRAAEHDAPYMLKGSLVTRQYLPDPTIRWAEDIDWVYMNHIADPVVAGAIFSGWCTVVTETHVPDGVIYKSFRENDFWRMIDYAMADDFPTVNTDLECRIDDKVCDYIGLDISFNLDINVQPVPLLYRPLSGEPFLIRYTCPLSLQVAWKLHQTLVSPRYKDVYDLIHLLGHRDFDRQVLSDCIAALINECARDKISLRDDLLYLMADPHHITVSIYDDGEHTIPGPRETFPELMQKLLPALRDRGLTTVLIESLPALPGAATSLQRKMNKQRAANKESEEYRLTEQIRKDAAEARRKLAEALPARQKTPYTTPVQSNSETLGPTKIYMSVEGMINRLRAWLGV